MSITWPTGLGCSSFGAETKGLVPIGDQVQFVVEIRNAKTGTLNFPDGETLSLKKTRKILPSLRVTAGAILDVPISHLVVE